MDVRADQLARDLSIGVAELLQAASDLMDETFRKGSYAALEGMTTRTVQNEQSAHVTISPKLAEALRRQRAEPRPGRRS